MFCEYECGPGPSQGPQSRKSQADASILQEEAMLAPDSAITQLLAHVRSFFPSLPGSGVARAVPGESLWFWGTGYQSWRSGGKRVLFHGLSGRWKGQGWNED